MATRPRRQARFGDGADPLIAIVDWYFATVFGRHEGPGIVPFYCDPARVGRFALNPERLAQGDEASIFQLFVGLAMFQARRDVLIMQQQRSCTRKETEFLISATHLGRQAAHSTCPSLQNPATFVSSCSVRKINGSITCDHADQPCSIREASKWFRRLGDHGKLPMSAYFEFGRQGDLPQLLAEAEVTTTNPSRRAEILVVKFARAHRVGRKLATLFVSALSTPALAPGLTPWHPLIDGNELVVIDTHAARAIDRLRQGRGAKTYSARSAWLRRRAKAIDLHSYRRDLPSYSPRLIQQALYAFGSKSNRLAWNLPCVGNCLAGMCPFHESEE